MNTPDLKNLRQAIDGVDTALADLLACRADLSRKAQAAKAQAGLSILDPARENEVQQRYEHTGRGLSSVAQAILEWCRHEH
jgi:chorismate mutase